ncbi:unnamed protein product [Orchesella dallaii]|uniref:glutathione transferase n=1 Tax=Orchesella dallaii TaxID=48710 RepID=A0ABP1RL64_9HEXA
MSIPKYKVTYFNYMWLAEPIRYLLSYVKEDFEDVRVSWEEWEKPDGKINKDGRFTLISFSHFSSHETKTTVSTPKYKVIYFNFRWLAEPIRYLLSYVKEDFEDVRVSAEEFEKLDGKTNKDGK